MSKISTDLRFAVEDFLFLEADWMDKHRYDEWFALWTEELQYWVPCNEDDYDPAQHVSLIFDDRGRLQDRIYRMKSKFNHTQMPPSRLSRVVSNIRVEQSADTLEVASTFSLTEARAGGLTVWAGRQKHLLVPHGDSFMIRQKSVFLVNNDQFLQNLSFLI